MRAPSLALVLAVSACADKSAGGGDVDSDTPVVTDASCTETYSIPGTFGAIDPGAADPHQEVYGTEQSLGGDGSATVGPDPIHTHLGWPGSDAARSVSFVWQTDTGTLASVVELAEGNDLSGDVVQHQGASFAFGSGDYRVHELKLCGRLKPGTTYSYRVGGEQHWSDVFTFTTPGEAGSFDSFTVAVAGDSRGAYEDWGSLVQRAMTEDPDFFVFTGDMVAVGGDQLEWHAWWEAVGDAFAGVPLLPAHGNHEFLATNYFAQFSLPNNEQWFSIDYGPATFVSLNDTVADPASIAGEEADFLDHALSTSTARWKLAVHHQTMVTASDAHAPNADAYAAWGPILDQRGADLVLAGHNHLYERSTPIAAGAPVDPGQGPVYLVAGGAGAPLYTDISTDPTVLAESEVADPVNHYVLLTFSTTGIHGVAKDMRGNTIDTFDVAPRE